MALSWSDWQDALDQCKDLKDPALVAHQIEPLCPNQEEWKTFCVAVVNLGWPESWLEEATEFAQDHNRISAALYDNYFVEAVKLVRGDADRSMPALAWAAFNKHEYKGYADECAVVRFLTWAGFDVNAGDADGQTPLHLMAQMKVQPGSHPRAVQFLLDAGANPNARRRGGDTPLTALSANMDWTQQADQSARILLGAGADPLQPSEDGATSFSVLRDCQSQNPCGARGALIAEIEAAVISAGLKTPSLPGGTKQPPL